MRVLVAVSGFCTVCKPPCIFLGNQRKTMDGMLTTKQDQCWIMSLSNSKLVRLLLLITLLYKQRN